MKTEIEKLVDDIYHRQTYGKNADKQIEKLNKLTGVNKPTKAVKNNFVKPVVRGTLPNNLILYRQAKKLNYAEFCKWLNAKSRG